MVKLLKVTEADEIQESSEEESPEVSMEGDAEILEGKEGIKIYKEDLILQKVQEIRKAFSTVLRKKIQDKSVKKIPFFEHMSQISDQKVQINEIELDNDVQREVQFYQITKGNVDMALKKLQAENVELKRPDDYFAEMIKSDQQMRKIKNLLVKKQVQNKIEEEKVLREENKKMSKMIRAKKEFSKHKEKRQNLQAIEKWKEEIKQKGDKARDLESFTAKKGPKAIGKANKFGEKSKFGAKSNKFGENNQNKTAQGEKRLRYEDLKENQQGLRVQDAAYNPSKFKRFNNNKDFNAKKSSFLNKQKQFGGKDRAGGQGNDKFSKYKKPGNKMFKMKAQKRPGKVSRKIQKGKANKGNSKGFKKGRK